MLSNFHLFCQALSFHKEGDTPLSVASKHHRVQVSHLLRATQVQLRRFLRKLRFLGFGFWGYGEIKVFLV